jgi:hypothetical protein
VPASHFARNHFHQTAIAECFRSDSIRRLVRFPLDTRNDRGGKIVNIDRLQPIASVPVYAKYRQSPQRPGDIVDQNVFLAEQDRRPKYGMRQASLFDVLLNLSLASEIG